MAAATVDGELAALVGRAAQSAPLTANATQGPPGASAAVDAVIAETAYGVLQELLANALAHGRRAGRLEVTRRWAPDALDVEVVNEVESSAVLVRPTRLLSAGRGLTGLCARVARVGGRSAVLLPTLSAPWFTVRVHLPTAAGA